MIVRPKFRFEPAQSILQERVPVLGPAPPGEMFALRWNDNDGNSLRIDGSITEGMEIGTKTEGSNAAVWLPASIGAELEWWRSISTDARPEAFIFPTTRGTAIRTSNFLYRVLKEAGKKTGIDRRNHQMLRRTARLDGPAH